MSSSQKIVPTQKADRPVPPLPPPTQGVGRRRSFTGSGALRGCGTKLAVLLVLVGLFLVLVLPLVIESLLAGRLQTALRTPTKPEVEVSSNFPPELLLGRIDRIQVKMDRANLQGAYAANVEANLKGVRVSVPSLLEGNPTIEANSCSITAQAPAEEVPAMSINQDPGCLSYLGLGTGY